MTTTITISPEHGVRVLDGDGWREPTPGELFPMDGGNFLQVNAENYTSGFLQGMGIGVLISMVVLGVIAVAVS